MKTNKPSTSTPTKPLPRKPRPVALTEDETDELSRRKTTPSWTAVKSQAQQNFGMFSGSPLGKVKKAEVGRSSPTRRDSGDRPASMSGKVAIPTPAQTSTPKAGRRGTEDGAVGAAQAPSPMHAPVHASPPMMLPVSGAPAGSRDAQKDSPGPSSSLPERGTPSGTQGTKAVVRGPRYRISLSSNADSSSDECEDTDPPTRGLRARIPKPNAAAGHENDRADRVAEHGNRRGGQTAEHEGVGQVKETEGVTHTTQHKGAAKIADNDPTSASNSLVTRYLTEEKKLENGKLAMFASFKKIQDLEAQLDAEKANLEKNKATADSSRKRLREMEDEGGWEFVLALEENKQKRARVAAES